MPLTSALAGLADEPFVSLTTFRRSGEPVHTAVWVAREGDELVVTTPAGSGKVKRLRNDPRVELRPCSRTGRVADDAVAVPGTARITPDDDAAGRATADVLRRKYRLEFRVMMLVERLNPRGGSRRILRITG